METTEKNKYTFGLNHFVLYSKGWYCPAKKETQPLQVYKQILELDRNQFVTTMDDVVSILVNEFESYNNFCKENHLFHYTILTFLNRINDLTKYYNIDYQTAIVKVISSFFRDAEGKHINLKPPHYDRKLYKKGLIFNSIFSIRKQGQTYKEQNSIANQTFG